MSVYCPKNSTVFVYDFWRNGNRFFGSTGCKTRRQAERVEERKRAEAALDDGKRTKPAITLDDAAGLYDKRLHETKKWSPTAEYIMNDFVTAIGPTKHLSEITQEELSDYFAKRCAIVCANTVNREIDGIRPIWRRLRRTHDIGEMPDWGALRYAIPKRDPRELRHSEEDALFPHLREDLRGFAEFALKSGWRLAEVRNLRWSDLNFPAKEAVTVIKGGDAVKRPLTTELVCILASQPQVGPFVFTYVCQQSRAGLTDKMGRKQPARQKGERYPFSKTGWRKPWIEALEAAGIDKFRFHDLRHTRATRILRATNNLVLVKEALKHTSIQTTLRYAHAASDDVRRGLEASESRSIPEVPAENAENSSKSAKNVA